MPSSRLLIFVKNPVPGRVKTRLATDIGPERALEMYLSLMGHTFIEASKFGQQYADGNTTIAVYFSDAVPVRKDFLLDLPEAFELHQQRGKGLGERMKNAFEEGFDKGISQQVIIGSDCPQLAAGHLEQAFNALSTSDAVIGPARDGGYYLLGMGRLHAGLFDLEAWSHAEVFTQTLARIRDEQLSYAQIEELSDVDTLADLRRLGLS